MSGVKVDGPFNSPGVSDTPSRRKIFLCRPDSRPPERSPASAGRVAQRSEPGQRRSVGLPGQTDTAGSRRSSREITPSEDECARRIAASLARGAFRRPVTEQDVEGLMPFFDKGREGGFDAAIEQLIAAVLVSPEFLYRTIHTPAAASTGASRRADTHPAAGGAYPLTDLELASRLSFFLWSQGPDETLLAIAAGGKLGAPGALQAQALRMLKDPRASRLVRNFAIRSLDLDKLHQVVPDPNLFPAFTDALRRDMSTEIESFISSILLEDRDVGDLLTGDHTFLNDRLAKHYGIASVHGPQFRRVTLDDPRRWGLMGKGAVLLRTSYGDRTSPVLRGAWVLGKLMGTPPTPPPPDVDTDLSPVKGRAPTTLRARLEEHRSKPGCNQCHGVIDPIGLALENFDAVGRWRDLDQEAKAPIDARTVLPTGTAVNGPAELRAALFGSRGRCPVALRRAPPVSIACGLDALGVHERIAVRQARLEPASVVAPVVRQLGSAHGRFHCLLRVLRLQGCREVELGSRRAEGAELDEPVERLSDRLELLALGGLVAQAAKAHDEPLAYAGCAVDGVGERQELLVGVDGHAPPLLEHEDPSPRKLGDEPRRRAAVLCRRQGAKLGGGVRKPVAVELGLDALRPFPRERGELGRGPSVQHLEVEQERPASPRWAIASTASAVRCRHASRSPLSVAARASPILISMSLVQTAPSDEASSSSACASHRASNAASARSWRWNGRARGAPGSVSARTRRL